MLILHFFTAFAQDSTVVAVDTESSAETLTWLYEKGYSLGTSLLVALITLFLAWTISRWVGSAVRRVGTNRNMDPSLVGFLAQMTRYTVLAAGVISALGSAGVETTSVLAIFTSAGLAIGLALQGSLANFASGVMILWLRPFNVGDVVTAAGETGQVREIGLFATTLVNPSNHKIIVGNSSITGSNITNFTDLGKRRTTVGFGVEYGADIRQVVSIVEKAATACPTVLADPAPPAVAFVDMGASSLNFVVHSWSETGDWLACQHEVRTAVYDALNEAGIEIPFDQVVVHQAPAA